MRSRWIWVFHIFWTPIGDPTRLILVHPLLTERRRHPLMKRVFEKGWRKLVTVFSMASRIRVITNSGSYSSYSESRERLLFISFGFPGLPISSAHAQTVRDVERNFKMETKTCVFKIKVSQATSPVFLFNIATNCTGTWYPGIRPHSGAIFIGRE